MAFKAGTEGDLVGSMTQAIELAFANEWKKVKDTELPAEAGLEDRRILFAAIAQGVINHLKEQAGDSFVVDPGSLHLNGYTISSNKTNKVSIVTHPESSSDYV